MSNNSEDASAARDTIDQDEFVDPVIEAYKKDIDRTLLRENLKLTIEQRIEKAESLHESIEVMRGAARRHSPGQRG
jgi:hypothetical protein